MNTIIINAEDFNDDVFKKYYGMESPFMFDEFKLIIKLQGETLEKFKIYQHFDGIMINSIGAGWTLGLRAVKDKKEIYPSKGYMTINCLTNGDITIGPFIIPASSMEENQLTEMAEFLLTKEGYMYFYDVFMYLCGIMCIIMMKGMERKKIVKHLSVTHEPNKRPCSTKYGNSTVFYLDDIVEYVSDHYVESRGHRKIKCECWEVRGHYRHYKSGKRVFIPSYKKGKQRDIAPSITKTYLV